MNKSQYANEEINMVQQEEREEGSIARKERIDNEIDAMVQAECQKYEGKLKKLKKKYKRSKKEIKQLRAYIDDLEFKLQDTTSKYKGSKKKTKLYKGIIQKERYYHNENPFEDISKIYKKRKKSRLNGNNIERRHMERFLSELIPLIEEKQKKYIDVDFSEV